jgi:hypothetical protein
VHTCVTADDAFQLSTLVQQGIDLLNTRNGAGETALEMAQARGKQRALSFLRALAGEEQARMNSLAQIAVTPTHPHTHQNILT